ncbi:hypothetical protein [Nostoc sp. T09]|uniref:hypothetical protein n=1 Tax=Nostoc sp. T09 TaxID=1932621 RepID=UPI0015C4F5F3|nr:hypothetical protein [Nostoc sp. T09]
MQLKGGLAYLEKKQTSDRTFQPTNKSQRHLTKKVRLQQCHGDTFNAALIVADVRN